MLEYIKNVLSGRIKHWTGGNNLIVAEMWDRTRHLSLASQTVLKEFIVSAGIIVESLMLPQRGIPKIAAIDVRKVSTQQFRELYCVLLSYFIFMFYTTNRFLEGELKQALAEVTEQPDLTERILKSLAAITVTPPDRIPSIDMKTLGFAIWAELLDRIGRGTKLDLGEQVAFAMLAGNLYMESVKRIKASFSST